MSNGHICPTPRCTHRYYCTSTDNVASNILQLSSIQFFATAIHRHVHNVALYCYIIYTTVYRPTIKSTVLARGSFMRCCRGTAGIRGRGGRGWMCRALGGSVGVRRAAHDGGAIAVAKFTPFLPRHQIPVHATLEVVLGLQSTEGAAGVVLSQTAHVPRHEPSTLGFVI